MEHRIPWNTLDKDQLGYEANYTEKAEASSFHDGPRIKSAPGTGYETIDNIEQIGGNLMSNNKQSSNCCNQSKSEHPVSAEFSKELSPTDKQSTTCDCKNCDEACIQGCV